MNENEESQGGSAVSFQSSEQASLVIKATDGQLRNFRFDQCFTSLDPQDPSGTQEKVYSELGGDLVTSALDGYNCCLFAYGQTGAGKSHTMMGYADQPGVIPRAVEDVFRQKQLLSDSGGDELRVWASFVEIYNEQLRDLLDPTSLRTAEGHANLRIMDHPELGVIVPGLVEAACQTVVEVRKLIRFGLKKRVTSATIMNNTSSRSHAVFVLKVQRILGRNEDGSRESTNAKINLVDLAGSERHKSSDFQGHTFKEGCAINQSLSALALVIKELGEQQQSRVMRQRSRSMSIDKTAGLGPAPAPAGGLLEVKEVVPFRSSKLTFLLRDSLAGNTRSRMVACISPAAINADETISTCRFATSVKKVKTNACVNVDRKKGVVQHLQAEIRRLKKLLAARGVEVGALGAGSVQEEIADRERVLKTLKQSYQVQVEEARLLATARKEALNQQGLSSEDVDEVFGLEKNTPHLLNMSDDPVLSGCLVYFLPKGQITKVGSHPDNQIVIQGLGISNFICQFENPDQRNVVISLPSEYVSSRARVLVNGKLLARDERVTLQHFDRLIFGRASMMKLVIPLEQQDLAATKTDETVLSDDNDDDDGDSGPPVRSRRSMLKHDTLKLLLPNDSEAWSELRLYFGDLQARLGEERGNEFFYHLSKASHLVDEANEITTEIRPEDRLKFEVELVWDIHRHVSDIILIRALRLAQSQEPTVLSYWTVASFRQRLEVMRDCYDAFCCQGHWPGKGDPLEDPWIDASTVELTLQLHTNAEEQLHLEDIRRSLLDAKLETQTNPGTEKSTTPNISRRSSGRLGTGALTTPSVSRQSSKRQGSIQSVSSGRSSQRSSRLGHGQGGSALGKLGDEPGPPNSARGKRPPGEEVHSRASSKTSTNGGVPRLTVPPRPVVPSLAVPPPASVEAPPTPAPAPVPDEIASSLRQQLKEKEDVEAAYRAKIDALKRDLQELQRRHGPLRELLGGVASEGFAPPVRRCTGSGSPNSPVVVDRAGVQRVPEPLSCAARLASPWPGQGTATAPALSSMPSQRPSPRSGMIPVREPTAHIISPRSMQLPNGTTTWPHHTPRRMPTAI